VRGTMTIRLSGRKWAQSVLKRNSVFDNGAVNALRCGRRDLEAALFMWGYDLMPAPAARTDPVALRAA